MNKKYLIIVLLALLIGGGYVFWNQYHNSADELGLQKDEIGGKTPQETLHLFIAALEKDDMTLAASYFIDTGQIGRKDWRDSFEKIKDQGLLDEMIADVKKATPDPNNSGSLEYRFFLEGGPQNGIILLKFNSYTNVWKIDTL